MVDHVVVVVVIVECPPLSFHPKRECTEVQREERNRGGERRLSQQSGRRAV